MKKNEKIINQTCTVESDNPHNIRLFVRNAPNHRAVRSYLQHAYFIPIVGVGKRGTYELVHGDLPRQHPFGTTLRFTGPVPADSRQ